MSVHSQNLQLAGSKSQTLDSSQLLSYLERDTHPTEHRGRDLPINRLLSQVSLPQQSQTPIPRLDTLGKVTALKEPRNPLLPAPERLRSAAQGLN